MNRLQFLKRIGLGALAVGFTGKLLAKKKLPDGNDEVDPYFDGSGADRFSYDFWIGKNHISLDHYPRTYTTPDGKLKKEVAKELEEGMGRQMTTEEFLSLWE